MKQDCVIDSRELYTLWTKLMAWNWFLIEKECLTVYYQVTMNVDYLFWAGFSDSHQIKSDGYRHDQQKLEMAYVGVSLRKTPDKLHDHLVQTSMPLTQLHQWHCCGLHLQSLGGSWIKRGKKTLHLDYKWISLLSEYNNNKQPIKTRWCFIITRFKDSPERQFRRKISPMHGSKQ